MEIRFALSGSVLFSVKSDIVPSIGSMVVIKTQSYKKGLYAGSVIEVPITENDPPRFYYTEGPEPVVYIDLNGYTVLQEGTKPTD